MRDADPKNHDYEFPLRNGIPAAAVVLAVTLLGGCFDLPKRPPSPEPAPPAALVERVAAALEGRSEDAAAYAGLYAVLADRFEAGAFETTTEAAAVAGRAAEIVGTPGALADVVGEELNPLLGKPRSVTPEIASEAATALRRLSAACREVAR